MASRRRSAALLSCIFALSALSGCDLLDTVVGRNARLSEMVPGADPSGADLDCWLTVEFVRYPDFPDLRDVRVRFDSIALTAPIEFDWAYISQHDLVKRGGRFGSGRAPNRATDPSTDPPLGQPIVVRFPLDARCLVENATSPISLKAVLYWGGKKQHSIQRSIEHVYSHTPDGFF